MGTAHEKKNAKHRDGRRCQPKDWVTVHWKTFNDRGDKLEDSREYKKKIPIVF